MKKTISILSFLFLAFPITAFGQMFSLDNRPRLEHANAPHFRAGIKIINTEYMGADSSWQQYAKPPFEYSGVALALMFETSGLTITVASNAPKKLSDQPHSYTNFGLNYTYPFYLFNSRTLKLGIPVNLSTEHTTIRAIGMGQSFSFTNLNIGAGVIVNYMKPDKFVSMAQFTPGTGFYRLGRDIIQGKVFSLNGKFRINFHELLFRKGISLGYDYEFKANRNTGDGQASLINTAPLLGARDRHDHDFTIHTITLGIAF